MHSSKKKSKRICQQVKNKTNKQKKENKMENLMENLMENIIVCRINHKEWDGCKLCDDLVYNYKYDIHLCEDCEEGANLEDNKE